MSTDHPSSLLAGHLVVLSLVSFGGIPAALPDLRDFVAAHGWMTTQDFTNCFGVVQAIPGPNMILLMSFIGWQVGGLPAALACALAIFVPSCTLSLVAFRFWDRFRETSWQLVVRRGLAPVTIGLVMAGGFVMALPGDADWRTILLTVIAGTLILATRLNPLWLIGAAALGGASGVI